MGFVLSAKGLGAEQGKVQVMKAVQVPSNVKGVQRFLGLVGYYRRFIRAFAEVAKPLYILLRKEQPWVWGDEQQRAFEELKKRMTEAPVLALPRADRDFILHTDASGQALGAVLCQLDDEGGEHPVAFASRVLRGAELNYGITELEGLAVVWACKQVWPHYLTGSRAVVYTDHAALTYILAQSQSTGRLARWAIALQAFDLEMRYRPGRKHHVDALSRDVATLSSVQGQVEEPDKMEPLDESQVDNSSGVTVQQVTLAATVLTAGESSVEGSQ